MARIISLLKTITTKLEECYMKTEEQFKAATNHVTNIALVTN
jgi:hypothetical protein